MRRARPADRAASSRTSTGRERARSPCSSTWSQHVRDSPVLLLATARPELLDAQPTWGSGLGGADDHSARPLQPEEAEELAGRARPGGRRHAVRSLAPGRRGRRQPALPRGARGLGRRARRQRRPAGHRARGDRGTHRRDARQCAQRVAVLRRHREDVLARCPTGRGAESRTSTRRSMSSRRGTSSAATPSSQLSGDPQYTFKHMLIREVAYSTVPRAARRERHAAVAQHVEETIEGASETLSPILAYHWREGGEPTRAIPYLLAAADAARRGWAQNAVVDLYSKALELADEDEQRQADPAAAGHRPRRARRLPAGGRGARRAAPRARRPAEARRPDRARARNALDRAGRRDAGDRGRGARARGGARRRGRRRGGARRGESGPGHARRRRRLERALELGDRALELWVPDARPHDLREHLHLHADATYWVGQYERSVDLSRRTRAVASDVHSAESLLRGGGSRRWRLTGLGRHEEAIAIFDELFEIARELGQSPLVVLNYSSLRLSRAPRPRRGAQP